MATRGSAVLGLIWALLGGFFSTDAGAAESAQRPAPNTLQAVDYALLPAGGLLIRVTFRNALKSLPAVLITHHPTFRIALDFPDTISAAGKQPFEVRQGGLRSYHVAQSGGRTRLVLNLDRPFTYETELKGRELLIRLERRPPAASRGAPGRFQPAVVGAPEGSLRDVAFQAGAEGTGRVLVEVSHASVPVDVRRQGTTLVLDFLHADVPPDLARRLDVQDFGTPIRSIETYPAGGHARIAIELAGAEEIAVHQLDRRFILAPY